MNHQEIFNKVATHLLTQNKVSIMDVDVSTDTTLTICAYRGKENTRCAFGILIDDLDYNRSMEGKPIYRLVNEYVGLDVYKSYIDLIVDLQKVHDDYNTSMWYDKLLDVAKRHDLHTKVMRKFG